MFRLIFDFSVISNELPLKHLFEHPFVSFSLNRSDVCDLYKFLPDEPCIYLLINREYSSIDYIGSTKSPRKRFYKHHIIERLKLYRVLQDYFIVCFFCTDSSIDSFYDSFSSDLIHRLDYEKLLIKSLSPRFNVIYKQRLLPQQVLVKRSRQGY